MPLRDAGVYTVKSAIDPGVPWLTLLVVPPSMGCPVADDGIFVLRKLRVGEQVLRVYHVDDSKLGQQDFDVFVAEDGTMRPDVLWIDERAARQGEE